MKKIVKTLLLIIITISFFSCSKQLIGTEKPNTPLSNFESLWTDFDIHYGSFIPRKIDWENQKSKCSPLINNSMNEEELYKVLVKLLDTLNDDHVFLRPMKSTGLPWYTGGIIGRTKIEDFDKKVAQAYLKRKQVYNKALEYGVFDGNVGYLNIIDLGMNYDVYPKAMDVILDSLKNTKGIIIELRENGGGSDRVAQYIANRFASSKHLAFTASLKKGPNHSDFAKPIESFTEPAGNYQYIKPVVLLTNLNCFSSGETFVLAMQQNSNVKLVGDYTGGALSDAVERELPNGWLYRLPIADVRDATGKSLEGIGIMPDYLIKNSKAELKAGTDKVLEKGLILLK